MRGDEHMNWRMLALCLPLLLGGCEECYEMRMASVEAKDGKTVKSDVPETVSVTTGRFPSDLFFKTMPKQQPIPSNFPLALYPGAELLDVTKHSSTGQTLVVGEIEPIKDSPTVISDFYRKKLELTGWTIKPPDKSMVTPDTLEISAIRGKQSIAVTIWDREHNKYRDLGMIENWKRRDMTATSISIDLYDLDHDAQ
jgi:hypothetical protein